MKVGHQHFNKLMGLGTGVLVALTACQPAQNSDRDEKVNQHLNQNSYPNDSTEMARTLDEIIANTDRRGNHGIAKANVSNISSNDDIARRLEISYARNAAYKKDECPKLVEFESIDQTVTRQGEQLPSDYCEYFVFLNQGDILSIHTSTDMHAKLISPVWFDFNNGSYTAQKFDKYTVRLSYNGVRYHPTNFRYDVSLVKSGIKSN